MASAISSIENANPRPYRVAVIVIPQFSLMAFSSVIEPMRSANLLSGRKFYDWAHLSVTGGPVPSSSGVQVLTEPLPSKDSFDLILVCAGIAAEKFSNPALSAFLRRAHRRGAMIGAVSTGTYILARIGLLEGRRCTLHWDCLDAFQEEFPELQTSTELFVTDGPIVTCAGGTAALDLMLHLMRTHHGDNLAGQVSDQFIHGALRPPRERQRMDIRNRLDISHPILVDAIRLMEERTSAPIPSPKLARQLAISERQLERLFKAHLGCSPNRYFTRLRLDRARRLLRQTAMPVTEIALACGFATASHFSKSYRDRFGRQPSADRSEDRLQPAEPGVT